MLYQIAPLFLFVEENRGALSKLYTSWLDMCPNTDDGQSHKPHACFVVRSDTDNTQILDLQELLIDSLRPSKASIRFDVISGLKKSYGSLLECVIAADIRSSDPSRLWSKKSLQLLVRRFCEDPRAYDEVSILTTKSTFDKDALRIHKDDREETLPGIIQNVSCMFARHATTSTHWSAPPLRCRGRVPIHRLFSKYHWQKAYLPVIKAVIRYILNDCGTAGQRLPDMPHTEGTCPSRSRRRR